MKSSFTLVAIMLFAANVFAQQTEPSATLTKDDYLRKSRHQRVAGMIMVPAGIIMGTVGAVISIRNTADDINRGFGNAFGADEPARKSDRAAATILMISGSAAVVTGIVLLVNAGNNKRKANAISWSIKSESLLCLNRTTFTYRPVPSLSVRIRI